ncbi:fatty acid--CoA ligase [Peribacillus cavernae]|uniref:Fatty acid--CoA ligase n=1 Tax=Peribacillus cavernae TaxID=1674310 RepID=A0A433H9C1_9BACI|nr:fatty acid--CoA ligase [Peribacillus cavernae]MDQ0220866.1 fatty-acyl-CoA synthase [Peribacillus cavernae]RUQ24872.1 fatty acid--CoA ligase [Peribacillus cavernae]
MSTTIGKIFDLTVKKFPNKEALYDERRKVRYTYQEWSHRVNSLANALLADGVKKGDRVSTYLYNNEELATAFFACAKIGAVFNPINFRLMEEELSFILSDAKPKVVLFEEALETTIADIEKRFPEVAFWFIDENTPSYAANYHEKVANAPQAELTDDIKETDLYAIMYTSGTTGRPKGVLHRQRDMVEQSMILINGCSFNSDDIGLITAPMFHCAELHCTFLPRVHVGAKSIILHQFDPKKVLQLVEEERVTKFFAAPTMWNMLLQENLDEYNTKSLKLGLYGAAPMAPTLVKACREKLGIELVQAYGMTEMGPAITLLSEEDQIRKAGSAGQACLNHEIIIARPKEDGPSDPDDVMPPGENGEILVKGPCMMSGYFGREEANEKALYKGWYHSGDIGYLDEEGYLWVKDRVDDMIISGGENVYPREVEDTLYEHAGVLDCAVLGQPDDRWGETVTAFVVAKDSSLSEEELEEWCKNSRTLANYKRPRKYMFCNELPRNASGKIQKFILRKQLEDAIHNHN